MNLIESLLNENRKLSLNKNRKRLKERAAETVFKKGDIVVAKDEFLNKGEEVKDTIGIVLDHKAENDYLQLGVLHPEDYAFPPIFNGRGEYYRLITDDERSKWIDNEVVEESKKKIKESHLFEILPEDINEIEEFAYEAEDNTNLKARQTYEGSVQVDVYPADNPKMVNIHIRCSNIKVARLFDNELDKVLPYQYERDYMEPDGDTGSFDILVWKVEENKKKEVKESCDKLSPQEIGYLTRLYGYEYGLSLKDAQKQIKSMSPEKQCELYTVLKQGFEDQAKKSFYTEGKEVDKEDYKLTDISMKNKSTITETYQGELIANRIKQLEEFSKVFNNDISHFLSEIRRILCGLSYKWSHQEILSTEYEDCLSRLQLCISDYVTFIQQLKNMSKEVGYATDVLEKFDAGQLTAEELCDELIKSSDLWKTK